MSPIQHPCCCPVVALSQRSEFDVATSPANDHGVYGGLDPRDRAACAAPHPLGATWVVGLEELSQGESLSTRCCAY